MELGQINLYVRDLDDAARYYAAILGFTVSERGEDYCTLKRDQVELTLFPVMQAVDPAPARGAVPGMTADLVVDDLDAAIEAIRASGGEVDEPREWSGGRYALFTDPDGIGWELIEELPGVS
jgi:predicted enzyme related to lactoylglutathione lyase